MTKKGRTLVRRTLLFLMMILCMGFLKAEVNAATTVQNPTYDGYDYIYSYVYFGSYPQSEVTDTETKNSIDAKLIIRGKTEGDVWVDGIQYRKEPYKETYEDIDE